MNQSIRPLPFAPSSDKGVAEPAALLSPSTDPAGQTDSSDFGHLLDSELEDQTFTPQKYQHEVDPWTILGIAQLVLPITEPPPVDGSALIEHAEGELDSTQLSSPEDLPAVTQEIDLAQSTATNTSAEPATEPQNLPRPLLERLKLSQQNLPVPVPPQTLQPEQIAGNPPVPAKISNGIPVAQVPPMLLASQKQEETAPQQEIAHSDEHFEASGFAPAVQSLTNKPQRDPAPKQDFDLAEFVPAEAVTPEWSSFEGISETSDLQAPKRTESVEVAQAIRTHVELLRTSHQDKLDVVLRPDGQTEIRLHVEKVNGQILVQARCDRGDFARLDANWNAIQQTLASQGVRVEALQNGATFQHDPRDWNHQPDSSGQHQSSSRERELTFIEQERSVPHLPTRPRQSAATNGSARGWQSWA